MKKVFKKYPCPSNCSSDPPKVNPELWKLLNSNQRKSDVKLVGIQKSLKKALNATILMLEEAQKPDFSVQSMAQKTVDIAAILGHASYEVSLKRRVFVRSAIKNEYKDLCAATQPITTLLFGDDLPKLVKGLNLTNKLGYKNSNSSYKSNSKYRNDGQYRSRPYYRNSSFLGRGRGNLPYNNRQGHQKRGK